MAESSGTLLFKEQPEGIVVLIVHPSGNYNIKSPWSIPKGKLDQGENYEQAARRETLEETGIIAPEKLFSLGYVSYKSKKKVHAFVGKIELNVIPTCASWEIDKAEFVSLEEAEEKLHPAQKIFIQRFRDLLGKGGLQSR